MQKAGRPSALVEPTLGLLADSSLLNMRNERNILRRIGYKKL